MNQISTAQPQAINSNPQPIAQPQTPNPAPAQQPIAQTPTNPNTTQTTPPKNSAPNNKKWFLIIGSIVVALVLIAGGVFAYQQYSSSQTISLDDSHMATTIPKSNVLNNATEEESETTIETKLTSENMESWNTYQSPQKSFSISYPKDFYSVDSGNSNTLETSATFYNEKSPVAPNRFYVGFRILKELTFNEFKIKNNNINSGLTFKEFKLGNLEVKQILGFATPGGVSEEIYLAETNNKLIEIRIGNVPKNKNLTFNKFILTVEKMFSTFEFASDDKTAQQIDTTSWKWFDSQNTNFKFKYPPSVIKTKISGIESNAVSLITSSEYSDVQETIIDIAPIVIYNDDTDSPRKDTYFGGYKWSQDIFSKLENLKNNEVVKGTKENLTKKSEQTIGGYAKAINFEATPNVRGEKYIGWVIIHREKSFLAMYFPNKSDITEDEFNLIILSSIF